MYDKKTNKKGFKRIRKPVMYDIEPLPEKIAVDFFTGDQGEQAFIGSPYKLKVKFTRKEQVAFKSLKMVVLDIVSTPMQFSRGATAVRNSTIASEVSQSLTDVSLLSNVQDDRLTASMFTSSDSSLMFQGYMGAAAAS